MAQAEVMVSMNVGVDLGPRGESPRALATAPSGGATRRSRHAELLVLCARIDFNP